MTINHLNIVVADMQRTLDFYIGLLGMRQTFDVMLQGEWIEEVTGCKNAQAHCVFVMPDGGGCRIEILQYINPEGTALMPNALPHTQGLRHFALEVMDLDSWHQKLSAASVSFVSPPVTVPFRIVEGVQKRLCYCHDPDGVIVELCEHLRS
ncbi:MAG: VOC family protein [Armatimonadetes bacterium]|nr:VOC family protein [Armatimonadota bacterium]